MKRLVIAFALIAAAVASLALPTRPIPPKTKAPDLVASMPALPTEEPYAVFRVLRGEMPRRAVELFASFTEGEAPFSRSFALLPIVELADDSCAQIFFHSGRLTMISASLLSEEDAALLAQYEIPEAWGAYLPRASLDKLDDQSNVMQLTSPMLSAPIYVELDGRVAHFADQLIDIERMREARAGEPAYSLPLDSFGGAAIVSDGGAIASRVDAGSSPLVFDVRWGTDENSGAISADWNVDGLEPIVGKKFLDSLAPTDWSSASPTLPEPLICSFGLALPSFGDAIEGSPLLIREAAAQLAKLKIAPSDAAKLLEGQTILSLGGRAHVLWFDLPGVIIELFGRGDAGRSLVDGFWREIFLGANPIPIEGYDEGGMVEVPFQAVAAAGTDRTMIGLTRPSSDRRSSVESLVKEVGSAVGWAFVDLSKIGDAVYDIPAFNALLGSGDEPAIDEETAQWISDFIYYPRSVFVIADTNSSGRAILFE